MDDDVFPPATGRPTASSRLSGFLLKSLAGYFALSLATLPLLNAFWIGELPVLALVQLPKIAVASWLRREVVMEAIRLLGLSRGSASPDLLLARPYGLAPVYLFPVGVTLAVTWARTRLRPPYRKWCVIVICLAVADFVATLVLGAGRSLTIY